MWRTISSASVDCTRQPRGKYYVAVVRCDSADLLLAPCVLLDSSSTLRPVGLVYGYSVRKSLELERHGSGWPQ